MKKTFLFLLSFFALASYAQDRVDRPMPTVSKPIATLDKAIGWRLNTETGVWDKGQNKIEDTDRLDQFDRFEFRIVNHADTSYLLLRKNYEIGHYAFPASKEGWTGHKAYVDWVINLKDYKNKIDSLKPIANELVADVLICKFDVAAQGQAIPKINAEGKAEKQRLIIKFRVDETKKTVRFFIYSREELGNGFFNIKYLSNNHVYNSYTPKGEIINSDKLYDNFYYETNADLFLSFIKAPAK